MTGIATPINLWIVEDNTSFRKTIVNLINQSDSLFCDKSFADCREILYTLQYTQAPNVILMDIGLPGMSGLVCIQQLKARIPSTDIIMLTIHDDDENVFRAICYGASGYLLKSTPAQKLIESLREISNGGAPINPRIARRILEMFSKSNAPTGNYNLTDREKDILRLMLDGLTKQNIADELTVSYHTIDTHIKNIYAKLQVHSRSGAVAKALKERLI
jgi:DNA-binding NarL/FixJ family response regulator